MKNNRFNELRKSERSELSFIRGLNALAALLFACGPAAAGELLVPAQYASIQMVVNVVVAFL